MRLNAEWQLWAVFSVDFAAIAQMLRGNEVSCEANLPESNHSKWV